MDPHLERPIERQDPRTLDDPIPSLEQELQPPRSPPAGGSNAMPPAHLGTDNNVISDMDRWHVSRPGSCQCTVAGRLHCYAYSWADNPGLREHHRPRRLELVRLHGYRGGYGGCEGEPDDIQSRAVARQSAALEMAAPRALGPSCTLPDLLQQHEVHRGGRTHVYSSVGPGSCEPVCCVVQQYPQQLRMRGHSLPAASCNRCDLTPEGRVYYSYAPYHARSGKIGPSVADLVPLATGLPKLQISQP